MCVFLHQAAHMHLTVTLLHCWLIRFELRALLHTFPPLLHKPEHFQCPNFLVETKKQIHTSDTPLITMKSPPSPLVRAPLDSHTPCVGGPWGSPLSLSRKKRHVEASVWTRHAAPRSVYRNHPGAEVCVAGDLPLRSPFCTSWPLVR